MQFEPLQLADGRVIRFRYSRADDAPAVAEAMRTASDRTLRNRFFALLRSMPEQELRRWLDLDQTSQVCVVALADEAGRDRLIGGIRFVRLADPTVAEVALTIHDDYQRHGIGTRLLRLITPLARSQGVRRFTAEVLDENHAVFALLRRGRKLEIRRSEPGVRHLEWEIGGD